MSQAVADSVRSLRRIAVSDTYRLAPDAEAMVASDAAWYREHPEAKAFKGEKWCCADWPGTQRLKAKTPRLIGTDTNSGLAGLHLAVEKGATHILLFGFDLHLRAGLHFFGPHTRNPNPTEARFAIFLKQFAEYAKRMPAGIAVYNCTPASALKCFPAVSLAELGTYELAPC